jgi:hypothetical protein
VTKIAKKEGKRIKNKGGTEKKRPQTHLPTLFVSNSPYYRKEGSKGKIEKTKETLYHTHSRSSMEQCQMPPVSQAY